MALGLGLGLGLVRGGGLTTFTDATWLQTETAIPLQGIPRSTYRVDMAQSIRDGAGIESGETTGVEDGVTTGLTDAGALVADDGPITYSSYASFSADADSGTGTAEDPFIFENRDFDNSETTSGTVITINTGVANTNAIFRNCRFRSYAGQCFSINALASGCYVYIENCDFDDSAASGDGIRISTVGNTDPDQIIIRKNKFAGFNEEAIVNFGGSCTIENNSFEGTGWGTFSACIQDENSTAGLSMVIQYNDFDTDTEVNLNLKGVTAYTITNNDIVGGDYGIAQVGVSGEITAMVVENNLFTDQTIEAVRLDDLDGGSNNKDRTSNTPLRFWYNELTQSNAASTNRVFLLGSTTGGGAGQWCENVDVAYCKVTNAGAGAGNNESMEMFKAKDSGFRYCWVTETGADEAFEFAYPISGFYCEYCVGDNTVGQIVDIFRQWDGVADNEETVQGDSIDMQGYIHHIYGECNSYGVILTGVHGVVLHDIYTDNSAASGSEAVIQVSSGAFAPKNIKGAGPLTLAADRAGVAVKINGGTDIQFRFFDNENGTGTVELVIPALALWLDASDTGTITESGGAVSQWDDKSGNSNHATQGSGSAQPATGARTINGKNAIAFNGTSHWMDIPNNTVPYGPTTLIAVHHPDDTAVLTRLVFGNRGSGGLKTRLYAYNQGTDFGNAALARNTPDTSPVLQISWCAGTGNGVTQYLKINDETALSGSVDRDTSNNEFTLGAFNDGENNEYDGGIGEFIVYTRALSDAEINQLGQHLADKWGITWTDI